MSPDPDRLNYEQFKSLTREIEGIYKDGDVYMSSQQFIKFLEDVKWAMLPDNPKLTWFVQDLQLDMKKWRKGCLAQCEQPRGKGKFERWLEKWVRPTE